MFAVRNSITQTHVHSAEGDKELHGLFARGECGDLHLLLVLRLGVLILVTGEVAGRKVEWGQLGIIVRRQLSA